MKKLIIKSCGECLDIVQKESKITAPIEECQSRVLSSDCEFENCVQSYCPLDDDSAICIVSKIGDCAINDREIKRAETIEAKIALLEEGLRVYADRENWREDAYSLGYIDVWQFGNSGYVIAENLLSNLDPNSTKLIRDRDKVKEALEKIKGWNENEWKKKITNLDEEDLLEVVKHLSKLASETIKEIEKEDI